MEEKFSISLSEFYHVVEATFKSIFCASALSKAQNNEDERKCQLLLRLRDFATVVEANRSMSAGDIGRLMYMWKRWSLMIQGMKGLTHYSNYLPRLVLLLTKTLPKPLAHLISHSLLITSSGRPNHFVAKDFFLEVQNYWIKFFHNHSVSYYGCSFDCIRRVTFIRLTFNFIKGTGTEIARLKDTFSINVPFVS